MHTIKAFFVKSYDEKPKICRCQSRAEKSNFDSRAKLCSRDKLDSGLRFGHSYVIIYLMKLLEQKDYKWITVAMVNPNP